MRPSVYEDMDDGVCISYGDESPLNMHKHNLLLVLACLTESDQARHDIFWALYEQDYD